MFDTERLPIRIADIKHRQMEKEEKEIQLVELTCEINPFTAPLAAELDDFVRATLFTRTDAAVTEKLHGAAFRLSPRPQEIVIHSAPDQGKATLTIAESKIGTLFARRSKKSAAWRLVFTVTFAPTSKDQLATVVDAYLKTRYFTFADASPDLFSETGKARRKTAKAERAAGIGVEASAATH